MTEAASSVDDSHVLLVGEASWIGGVAGTIESDTPGSVARAQTAVEAMDTFESGGVDCIVSAIELAERDGLWLLRSIREQSPTVPVLLCTANGSEAIASEAVSAGATDYIPVKSQEQGPSDEIVERITTAIQAARESTMRRARARQFDAMFHDDRTFTWILDPTGSVTRINAPATNVSETPITAFLGEPFWRLPWWPSEQAQSDVRRIIETAARGQLGNAVIMDIPMLDGPGLVELVARPVYGDRDGLDSIVVEGIDITDRVTAERNLRQSEKLHRVTLNNMTDTVLITDDDGRFTYVCPNVHFIFGYTAGEIHDIGSIEGLLGENLFDRSDLARERVLKNIECTATDKAGQEHTLLVNVREVAIQDGSVLYSCRDITKRKQRERALTTLQGTARDFLFAETRPAIAEHLINDVPEVLNTEASAVYLFDAESNELQPAAVSPEFERLHRPSPSINIDTNTLPSYCFVEDESLFFDDVHQSPRLDPPSTEIRSAAYIPLGDHGVFIAGAAEAGQFAEVERELADLVAATGEAALERVNRETRLREQEQALQTRNRQLSAVNRVNEIIREIDQALVQAETRAEVEHEVCERLTDDDRFTFAWIGEVDAGSETVTHNAFAGDDRGYLDSHQIHVGETGTEPAGRTAALGEVTLVSNVAGELREEAWRKEAISRDYRSVMNVPLTYGDVSYGVLTVYARIQGAFDNLTRDVLVELGETIASAISAITRTNALLTPTVTRVVLESSDASFLLARLAETAGCAITYQGGARTTAGGRFVFIAFDGASVDMVEQAADRLAAIEGVSRISGHGDSGVLRLQLSQPFFALDLADHGAVLRSATIDPDGVSIVIDVPDSVDLRHVTRLVSDAIGDVSLRSKQTVEHSAKGRFHARLLDRLTDRQLEVVQTAYFSGFFELPREKTGEEVASTLGISPQAFYQHTRTVERKVFEALFDETAVATTAHEPA